MYIKVKWIHKLPNEPLFLFSELDGGLWEKRKIDLFADGTANFASEAESHGDIGLSLEPLPPLKEIGTDPQFEPIEISASEFEKAWAAARNKPRMIGQ